MKSIKEFIQEKHFNTIKEWCKENNKELDKLVYASIIEKEWKLSYAQFFKFIYN